MEESLIYDLLFFKYIADYRNKLESEQENNIFKQLKESRENLEKNLTAEQLKLVESYKFNYTLQEEDIDFQAGIKILNYGIKIGMQLQKVFNDEE